MNVLIRSGASSRRWFHLVVALAAFLPPINLPAQPATPLSSADASTTAMKTFVIIFRQGSRTLTDTDKKQRAAETGEWARRQNKAGHKLDPRILAPESEHRGAEISADASPVTALLFLEAHDLNEAVQVAESHPALHYGASVEVRPWALPVPGA